jgi:site-specific DNA-methyltransferase (adenine-specific)
MLEPKNYNPEGRWPANVILDEEAGQILDQQSGNKKSAKRGSKYNKPTEHTNTYTPVASDYRDDNTYDDEGGASRFFYCPKASKKDRDHGLDTFTAKPATKQFNQGMEGKERSDGTIIKAPIEHKNIHPTVKPTDLMKYLIRLVTPKDGIVLDPFMGSGSTGKAAMQEGMWFVGIEREREYFEIAKQRIEYEADKRKFW